MSNVIPAVGLARDVSTLLHHADRPATDAATAVNQTWLWRDKIEGVWVYGTTDDAIHLAEDTVTRLTAETLNDWLLGPMHPLAGFIAKHSDSPFVTKDAARQIIRKLLRNDHVCAVAALTNDYEPYLAVFAHDDSKEIERQIAFMSHEINPRGRVSTSDLPAPTRRRTLRAWRDVILRHGEYLGLGHMESGDLVAWP